MVVAHHQFSSKMDLIKSLIRFLIMVPPVFVLIGAVTLSLLGFGVALAIESVFGVPRGMTYDSPLDLFNLGACHCGRAGVPRWVAEVRAIQVNSAKRNVCWNCN